MDLFSYTLVDGIRISLPRSITCLSTFVALEQEEWFEDEVAFVRALAANGVRAVDIGANFGFYTLALASGNPEKSVVWAFEPTALPNGALSQSIATNSLSNVRPIKAALSNFSGSTEFTLGWSPELNAMGKPLDGALGTEDVPVDTLDNACLTHDISDVDFVKIDAEGQELNILSRSARFLSVNSPLIMFEIKDQTTHEMAAARWLVDNGFSLYRLIPGLNGLVAYELGEALDPFCLNLFACRSDRGDILKAAGFLTDRDDVAAPAFTIDASEAYAIARSPDQSLSNRWIHLQSAFAKAVRDQEKSPTIDRLCLLTRVAADMGARKLAVSSSRQALQTLNAQSPEHLSVRLPALARFEFPVPDDEQSAWIVASLIESLIVRSAYSGYYGNAATMEWLLRLRDTIYWSAPMERRRQLLGIKLGMEQGFFAHSLLTSKAPDNQNPEFWSRFPEERSI